MNTNVELVQRAVGAAATGDVEAARALVTDDFVWHIPGSSPISGDITGVDAWSQHFARLFAAGLKPQVLATMEGGDHVAFLQRNVAENNGRSLDVQVVTLFTIQDGKVARMETFFGDQVAAETFWSAATV